MAFLLLQPEVGSGLPCAAIFFLLAQSRLSPVVLESYVFHAACPLGLGWVHQWSAHADASGLLGLLGLLGVMLRLV
ncbi:hypothetical protein, partial [Streptomyces zhihengii]|uniref:hypothetical protein n=1 Tax=Streptomyces zhihengii TaxID=1818004 RepID=UPI0033BE4B71